IDGRVYRAEEFLLRPFQDRSQVGEPHITDDHEVNITGGTLFTPRDGAINKGNGDTPSEPPESLGQNALEPYRAYKQPVKIAEERALRLRSIVDPLPILASPQNSRAHQTR